MDATALVEQFLLFGLILARTSGVVVLAPVFGGPEVPAMARVLLALMLAIVVAPTQLGSTPAAPSTALELALVMAGELVIGLFLGWGVIVILTGVQLAGGVLAQASGMSLADVFNPSLDASIPVFSQLLHWFATALFVVAGGHRLVLAAFLDTFRAIPPGEMLVSRNLADTAVNLVAESFVLGTRAVAPSMTALILATLVLGLIGRTLPQLNVLALGFGFSAFVSFSVLLASLAGIAVVFEDEFEPTIATLAQTLSSVFQRGT